MDGRKRIIMKTTTKNIAGACVRSMCIEFNLHHNVQFYRFRTFYASTHQNGSVDANRSMRFQRQLKRILLATFENAKVWTAGP